MELSLFDFPQISISLPETAGGGFLGSVLPKGDPDNLESIALPPAEKDDGPEETDFLSLLQISLKEIEGGSMSQPPLSAAPLEPSVSSEEREPILQSPSLPDKAKRLLLLSTSSTPPVWGFFQPIAELALSSETDKLSSLTQGVKEQGIEMPEGYRLEGAETEEAEVRGSQETEKLESRESGEPKDWIAEVLEDKGGGEQGSREAGGLGSRGAREQGSKDIEVSSPPLRRSLPVAAPIGSPAPLQGSPDPIEALARRILEVVRNDPSRSEGQKTGEIHLKKGESKAWISVEPDSLGEVKGEIIVEENQVRAHLFTNDPKTKKILEDNLHRLSESLGEQGLKTDRLSVVVEFVPSTQLFGNLAHFPFAGRGMGHWLSWQEPLGRDGEEMPQESGEKGTASKGSRSLVDLFV